MPEERWKPVVGYPQYEVSDQGRVMSHHRGRVRLMRPTPNVRSGYFYLTLCTDGIKSKRTVHALVAEAFCGPRSDGHVVRHLDGDPQNNAASNLAFGSPSENSYDSVRHGTHAMVGRTHCPQQHPYSVDNTRIYQGRRFCITCARERSHAAYLAAANVPTERAA